MKNHICFVAARSGGHIIPCLTLAQKIKDKDPQTDITFICTNHKLDKKLTEHPTLRYHLYLPLSNIPTKWYRLPAFTLQVLKAFLLSILHFAYTQPKKVISTGGYVAIPVVIAARIFRIPVELWELNVQPGKAIKFIAPFAQRINVCFNETQNYIKKRTQYASYPIRYTEQDKKDRNICLKNLNLDSTRKTIFVIGGSQGSHQINQLMKTFIEKHKEHHNTIQVIHQTGNDDPAKIQSTYKKYDIPSHVFSYNDNLTDMYNGANIIVSRAGAGTLAEISFFEKQCIIVPLHTKTNNHQIYNALILAQEKPKIFTFADAQSFDQHLYAHLN